MLFVAANDLLIMFVALEVLSLPLYLLCGAGPPPAAAVAGGGAQVLPARRVRLGVLPVRPGAGLRLRRQRAARRRSARPSPPAAATSCWSWAWRCWSSACCSRPASRRSTSGRRTSTRARRRRSPRSWPPAPRSPRSARCCGCSTSPSAPREWTWRPVISASRSSRWSSARSSAVTQTDLKRMLAYSSIAHAGFLLTGVLGLGAAATVRPVGDDVLPARLRLHHDRRVRRPHAGPRRRRRGDAPVPVGGPGRAVAADARR